jgi:hypothetical protein
MGCSIVFRDDVRNLLFKLSEKDETSGEVAWAVASYFDKLPDDVRNLLFKLSEKDEEVRTEAVKLLKTKIENTTITSPNSPTNSQSPNTGE